MKIRRLLLLASVVGVCLLLLTLQTRGRATEAADVVSVLVTPVQRALAALHRGVSGAWATVASWRSVRAENARLREENRRLKLEALVVREAIEENSRLRRLLDLRARLPIETLPGEVIAREWGGWVRSLTVNRGQADDVRRLTAVIAPEGLVGRVVDVRPWASVVQVLTDPASSVGAHAVRTRTPGVVEGDPRATLRFKFMARDGAGLQVGDLIVTSGLGGVFPRGIPIGRVQAIEDRGAALFHYAILTPAVDPGRLYEVLLVTGDPTRDLTAYFATRG